MHKFRLTNALASAMPTFKVLYSVTDSLFCIAQRSLKPCLSFLYFEHRSTFKKKIKYTYVALHTSCQMVDSCSGVNFCLSSPWNYVDGMVLKSCFRRSSGAGLIFLGCEQKISMVAEQKIQDWCELNNKSLKFKWESNLARPSAWQSALPQSCASAWNCLKRRKSNMNVM